MCWPRVTDLLTAGMDIPSLRANEDMGIPSSLTDQLQKRIRASTTCRYLSLIHIYPASTPRTSDDTLPVKLNS